MSAAQGPKPRKNAGRGGRRPAGRPGGAGRPGPRVPREAREAREVREPQGQPGVRITGPRPAPLDRNRCIRFLAGLFLFTLGFAVGGVLVVAGRSGTPPYLVAITIGVVGIAITVFAGNRAQPPMPSPFWTRDALGRICAAVGLRPLPVIGVLYALSAIMVLGNIVYPLTFGAG